MRTRQGKGVKILRELIWLSDTLENVDGAFEIIDADGAFEDSDRDGELRWCFFQYRQKSFAIAGSCCEYVNPMGHETSRFIFHVQKCRFAGLRIIRWSPLLDSYS